MTAARIVLSALCLLALLAACQVDTTNGGIGTSPSYDDVQAPVASTTLPVEAPPACGVWIDVTAEAADARALAGEPPDVVAFATAHATCSDAVTIAAERYPGRAFVRRTRQAFRAYEAP